MNKSLALFIGAAVIATAAVIGFLIWGIPYFFGVSLPAPENTGFGSEVVQAQVTQIIDEGTVNLGAAPQFYQDLQVKILAGQNMGLLIQVTYGKDQIQPEGIRFRPGDQILVTVSQPVNSNQLMAHYADAVRTRPILIVLAVFIICLVAVAHWKGLRSLVALIFSFVVVIGYILPHILNGEDPVTVSIIGSMILLVVTLYVTYGWNLKTHAAVLGILAVLAITGLLAWLFINVAFLTGNGDESALYLIQVPGIHVNLRGLLLGGMIIGALGVLDDMVVTQASAVFELHEANPALGFGPLFRSAYRIGQDHVASTVNTLVMAYTGVALPLLLLFTVESGNYNNLINLASVAEEIVRTLVGSMGLIAAVPLSTLIATALAVYNQRLGMLRPYLGSESGGGMHGHHVTPPAE
jgi:uncharacterized membrane protein